MENKQRLEMEMFHLIMIADYNLMLFVANVGSLKDEEVASSVSNTASVHTRQAASAVASSLPAAEFPSSTLTSPVSGRLAKAEEKAEAALPLKTGKRQKRLRNQQECISLDRTEKRVSECLYVAWYSVVTVSHWLRSVGFGWVLRKKRGFDRFRFFDHHQIQLWTSGDNAHARR